MNLLYGIYETSARAHVETLKRFSPDFSISHQFDRTRLRVLSLGKQSLDLSWETMHFDQLQENESFLSLIYEDVKIYSEQTHLKVKQENAVLLCGRLYGENSSLKDYQITQEILPRFHNPGSIAHALSELNGSFYAISANRTSIHLMSDKHRTQPLFYVQSGTSLIFSIHLRPLIKINSNQLNIDPSALFLNLKFPAPPPPYTLFKECRTVQRGSYISFDSNGIRSNKYWRIPWPVPQQQIRKTSEIKEELKFHLERAIKRRTSDSNYQYCLPLSSGIDSGIIAAIASQSNISLKALTYSLKNDRFAFMNEDEGAAAVANQYQLAHSIYTMGIEEKERALPTLGKLQEQIDSVFSPYFHTMKLAAGEGSDIILSGLGADESHGGFYYFSYLPLWQKWHFLSPLFRSMPRFRKDKWNNARILLSSPNIPNLYEKGFTKIDDRILHQVYASHKKFNSTQLILAIQGSHFQPNADIIDQLMYFMFANMPNHHLYRTHTYSRYFHQEVRYPFLDDDLIAFIFSIPGSIKTKNGTRKHLLKEISFDYLPDRIIKQKKKGLIAPSGYWLKYPLQSFSQEQYESLYQRSLFNADKLKQLITFNERYYPKQNDRWVSTAIWLKNFVD